VAGIELPRKIANTKFKRDYEKNKGSESVKPKPMKSKDKKIEENDAADVDLFDDFDM